MDSNTGDIYKCTAVVDGKYTWEYHGGKKEAVLYTPQNLEDGQKVQARENIGAASDSEVVKTVNGHAPNEKGEVNVIDDTVAGPDAWSGRKIDLSKASAIVQHAEGEPLSLNDSAEAPLVGLNLYGKTTQFTTTGKNLCPGVKVGAYANTTGMYTPSYTAYKCTEKIPCVYGQAYVQSNSLGKTPENIHYWDADGNWLKASYMTIAPPENASYFAINYADGQNVEWVQVELGNTATDYEPYTGGKPSPSPDYPQALKSVDGSGAIRVTVGNKNLLDIKDGDLASGYYLDANGMPSGENSRFIRIAEKPVCPNTTYTFRSNLTIYTIWFYSSETGKISFVGGGSQKTFTTPENCDRIRITLNNTSGAADTTAFKWAQLELGNTATEYEPGKEIQTLTVSTPNGLPGVPVASGGNYTDEAGQQWVCDEIDFSRGVYVQRAYRLVCDENLKIDLVTALGNCCRIAVYLGDRSSHSSKNALSTHLTYEPNYVGDYPHFYCDNYAWIFLPVSCGTTKDEIKLWLVENQYTILYQLETPTETTLSPEELEAYALLHTNKPNTTVLNDAGAGMGLSYVADTKTYIDNKFAELAAAIVNNA
jgi:hypothetical protein